MFSLKKRRLRGDLIYVYKYLKGRFHEDGAKLFSELGAQQQDKGQWEQTEAEEAPAEHEEELLPSEGDGGLNRLPREVVESPSLEIFQTRLDEVLCSLLWVTLLRQGVALDDPQRSLPTATIL